MCLVQFFKKSNVLVKLILVALLILAISLVTRIAVEISYSLSYGNTSFTVDSWERVTRNETSVYEVYTDNGVFINTDSWLRMKHDSADLRAYVQSGKTYSCTTQGFRSHLFSKFPNLIECKER